MEAVEYQIAPVLMGGVVKQIVDDVVKINLHGRLGVLYVPVGIMTGNAKAEAGSELKFYFSYIQVVDTVLDYDDSSLQAQQEFIPCLVGGTITEVNDTAAKIQIGNNMGTVAVPRRWLFTSSALTVGQHVEFYLSCMQVVEKKGL